jgi:3'-phosphoadenosine 5'-phosphosulfate sulfotransferase (PAPS reductase)/FAD synthetase
MTPRTVVWVSAGAASAVAAQLTLRRNPAAVLAYCETGAEHPDNERFLADLVRRFNRPIERLRSERYASTWDVWEQRRYLAGIEGALCTVELKIMPRIAWQMPTDIHVFGYTADARDVERASRLRETYFEMQIRTPLIEEGVTKAGCLALIERAGIELPVMYRLGFHNNNCIPCVKATSPNYWANVRQHFPAEFRRMAELARALDVRLCRIKDERRFIDEIPGDWPTTDAIAPACDFLCHIAAQDLEVAA